MGQIYQMKEGSLKSKIILFDLDGTLLDSNEAILESFSKAYESFGVASPSSESILPLIGLPLEMMFIKLGVSEADSLKYVKAYKEHYVTIHTQKTKLLPQVEEAIKLAHGYANLGVVTTKTSEYSRVLLEHFGLMKYFTVLIGREDVQNPKPHPEGILKATEKLNHQGGIVTYLIGDTCEDMIAAEEAEIGGIGVLTGSTSKAALLEYADFVTEDVYKAVILIEKI